MTRARPCLLALMVLAAGQLVGCQRGTGTAAPDDPVGARLAALQLDVSTLGHACDTVVSRLDAALAQAAEVEADLGPCNMALAAAEGDAAIAGALARYARHAPPEIAPELSLELASRAPGAANLASAGHALVQQSGHRATTGFDGVEMEAFWAGRGALRQALLAGASAHTAAFVSQLESEEFPLADGMAGRDPLLAVYFRRWPADSLDTRRLLGGFALGFRGICRNWETGINSVQFDRGLADLLAPVRATVPQRVIEALPSMGRQVLGAAGNAAQDVAQGELPSVLQHGLLGWNGIKRGFDGAIAIASADGRDAGIAMYQSVAHCRSPRALRQIDALLGAFAHYGPRSPLREQPAQGVHP